MGKQLKKLIKSFKIITTEYQASLRKYDVRFHGSAPKLRGQPPPPPGPLVWRLHDFELLKLVAGPWGDLSQDFHGLLKTFAEKRVEALARSSGRPYFSVEGELGKAMGEVRRAFSVTVVRSNALCLLERLAQLGPGTRAAGERRRAAQVLDERRRQQAQAYSVAHRQRGLSRVGRTFIPA